MQRVPEAILRHSFRHDSVQFDYAKFVPTNVLIRVRECRLFFFNMLAGPLVLPGADHLRNVHQAIDQIATNVDAQGLGPVTRPLLGIFHVLSRGDASCMEVMV
jgi:hypothetical protein